MTTQDEIRRFLRRYAREHGLALVENEARGKGSHVKVTLGDRSTFIPHKPKPNTVRAIRKQLGIEE